MVRLGVHQRRQQPERCQDRGGRGHQAAPAVHAQLDIRARAHRRQPLRQRRSIGSKLRVAGQHIPECLGDHLLPVATRLLVQAEEAPERKPGEWQDEEQRQGREQLGAEGAQQLPQFRRFRPDTGHQFSQPP